ncbi:unnamed protein product, partial [Prorocentrum cordatum]
ADMETMRFFEELKRDNPDIVETFVAQEAWPEILPSAPRDGWAQCEGEPCKTLVVRIGNNKTLTETSPEVFFSGALHGDERIGPLTVTELAGFLCQQYREGNSEVRRLVDSRGTWIMPMTNAHGYAHRCPAPERAPRGRANPSTAELSNEDLIKLLKSRGLQAGSGLDTKLTEVFKKAEEPGPADLGSKGLQVLLQRQSRKLKHIEGSTERVQNAKAALENAQRVYEQECQQLKAHQDTLSEIEKIIKKAQAATVLPEPPEQDGEPDSIHELQMLEVWGLAVKKYTSRFAIDATAVLEATEAKKAEFSAKLPKDAFRHQSAVKWAQQRGFQASMPKANSTGPGPTESSAGRAVLSQFPADKLDLSCGKELPSSRISGRGILGWSTLLTFSKPVKFGFGMWKPIFWSSMTFKDGVGNYMLAELMGYEFSMWSWAKPGRWQHALRSALVRLLSDGGDEHPENCMRTQTARAVNELFRRHLFHFMITFHGGMRALTYEWGSRNHLAKRHGSTESPDDHAFTTVGKSIQSAAGREKSSFFYPLGRISDLVYPVDGGMEDWSYGAGWEQSPNPITVCRPKTYGGYAESRTRYKPGSIATLVYLAEMDDAKTPRENTLGRAAQLWENEDNDGHVARNMRMCLKLIELAKAEVIVQPPAWGPTLAPQSDLALELHGFGCLTVSSARLLLVPRALVADCAGLGAPRGGGWDAAARREMLEQ